MTKFLIVFIASIVMEGFIIYSMGALLNININVFNWSSISTKVLSTLWLLAIGFTFTVMIILGVGKPPLNYKIKGN